MDANDAPIVFVSLLVLAAFLLESVRARLSRD